MKTVRFHPAALDTIRDFPKAARVAVGEVLLDLQHGAQIGMPLVRPMPSVGPGVYEIRVRDATGIYRVFHATSAGISLVVFHAFVKKTAKTPKHDIDLAKKRLKEMT
jgi:phage-related protein